MFKRLIRSHAMRRRTSWVIAAVLILPFILFFHGTGQAPPPGPGGTAGRLFGKPVLWETFQEQQAWLLQKLGPQAQELPLETLRKAIHQDTWDRVLLLAEAQRRRLRVTDRDVAAVIQQLPLFRDDGGRFRLDYYRAYLNNRGMSPQGFEQFVRQDLLIERVWQTVDSAPSTNREAWLRALRDRAKIQSFVEPPAAEPDTPDENQ